MISILLFSASMLIGCYLAGSIPLAFTFTSTKLRLVTIFGAGLLLGTALTVIIPEGINTMYSTSFTAEESKAEGLKTERKLLLNDYKMREVNVDSSNQNEKLILVHGGEDKEFKSESKHNHEPHSHSHTYPHSHSHSHSFNEDIHKKIGIILVTGFIFMLVVDHISSTFNQPRSSDLENNDLRRRSKSIPATIGLMIHSAADGIALGAASSMSHLHLEIIVFLAIMLHKGPAAFGFVSFLLHDNVERKKIKRYLLMFSLAAPVVAILTFLCLNEQAKEHLHEVNATGIALLFSAGTFLYVATVHVLPELNQHQHQTKSSGSNADISIDVKHSSGFSFPELLLIIFGCILPLILSIGHHH